MTLLEGLAPILATALDVDEAGGGFWLPPPASTIAEPVDRMYFIIYWICVFFFVLIVGVMVYFAWKYRRRPGSRPQESATHNTPLELTWTVVPLIMAIAIFYVGLEDYANIVQPPQNAYEVYATAQKWSWNFEHRNGAGGQDLIVPANRPVKVILQSKDVLHAIFIPAFRVKQDAVPGRYTYVWFDAEPGEYQLFCAEYCGTDHSRMTARVIVLPEEEFQQKIYEESVWIDKYGDDVLHKAGARLYNRCASCHTLDGSKKIGPSFQETHLLWGKERPLVGGGSVTVDENYVKNSLLNPGGQIVNGYAPQMPTFAGSLKPREVTAMIEFIKRLDEIVGPDGTLPPLSQLAPETTP